ncbi:hypothetical protein [Bacillus cereus]|uniref:hypothetical protein n=1 Tax=Bacillus cereus TaxID=1396 RepID=UPI00397F8047
MTEYHFDDEVYTDYTEFKKAIAKDWYRKYNKYMIKEFFYIGRKFILEGIEHKVIDNDVAVTDISKGWLYLQALGKKNTYRFWVSPRKVLKEEPSLKSELDRILKGSKLNETELHEQMELF